MWVERSSRKTWYRKCIETWLSAEQRHWGTVAEGQLDKNMCVRVWMSRMWRQEGQVAKKATVCIVL